MKDSMKKKMVKMAVRKSCGKGGPGVHQWKGLNSGSLNEKIAKNNKEK